MSVQVLSTPCCTMPHSRHTFHIVHPVNPHKVTTVVCEGLSVEESLKL